MRTPGLRETYRRALAGFAPFCLQRGANGISAGEACTEGRRTVALAREHVELESLERSPGPVQIDGSEAR